MVSSQALLEEDNQWMTQINRLQKLIDRLEKKVGTPFPPPSLQGLLSQFPHCLDIHPWPPCEQNNAQHTRWLSEWLAGSYKGMFSDCLLFAKANMKAQLHLK